MGPIWARGRGRGNRKSTKIWKSTKNSKVKKQNKKKLCFWNMVRFSQKTEDSTAGRLPMFVWTKVIKMLYKTEHNETQQKQNICQSPSKKWPPRILFESLWLALCRFGVPSKLPAANSRSGSTEGHGANGNLFLMGVLSVVCGFSLKLDAKKHGRRRNKLWERR